MLDAPNENPKINFGFPVKKYNTHTPPKAAPVTIKPMTAPPKKDTLKAGAKPLVIGGDDSIPTPVFSAFEGHGSFTILQIDAHIDWRDELLGERYGLSSTMRRGSEMAHIERIVQVGMGSSGSARTTEVLDALAWMEKPIAS